MSSSVVMPAATERRCDSGTAASNCRKGECVVAGTRINVIGASGSGTSTVGRSLAGCLSVAHFESDDYYHAPSDPPFQHPRLPIERHDLICRDLTRESQWVLSGGVAGWIPYPELDFTCIVFLYVPTELRIERLRLRELERFGNRILPGGDMHETHEEFLRWASRYDAGDVDGKTLQRHEAYLQTQRCPVLRYSGMLSIATLTRDALRCVVEGRAGYPSSHCP